MTSQAALAFRGRNPDVLTCIANLSNDEVFTPPELAQQMLDMVGAAWADSHDGASIWADPTVRFLDPFTKSGVFLREITARLVAGLAPVIPDLQERVNHILTKQVFGIAVTELTALLARRTLYCSKWADGPHSIATAFANPQGNIWFERTEHTWAGDRCSFCGASKSVLDRGEELESHAYAFTHTDDIQARIAELFGETMQFDVIIGNPPYQLNDGGGGGGASATPIYDQFVITALQLQPNYLAMVTPSRWFAGGKNLDAFRAQMLHDHRIIKLVDFPQLFDVFPNVKIRGGISYWLWGRAHDGLCEVSTMLGDQPAGKPALRALDAYDVLVRQNESVLILDKVASYLVDGLPEPSLAERVSARKPFGLTNQVGKSDIAGLADPVLLYGNQKTSFIERSIVTQNTELVDAWKVLLVKAHGTSGRVDRTILGEPVIASPRSACTETYLIIGVCSSETEAKNLAAYVRTRFVRFLVSLRKITQNITRDSYRFVPLLPTNRLWSDGDLFERYGITENEVEFIESIIAERSSDDASDDKEDFDE
jgi:hypothetical protein